MAEYIEREALIARCKDIADNEWNKRVSTVSWSDAYEQFADDVEAEPAADVVPVVRCRDCKHTCGGFGGTICVMWGSCTTPDGWCHKGERKDGDG